MSSSISGLLSTLVPCLLLALAYTALFLILRRKQHQQYAPRSYLGSLRPQERSPKLPDSLFGWIPAFNKLPDTFVLQHNSIDGYFLLRYLKVSVITCFIGCCITWPVLFPVNATGGGGQKQLNLISFSNVVNKKLYYAHSVVAWIFIGFVFLMVTRESVYYINTRQAYLLSPLYAARMSSRTVLFTSVPKAYVDEHKIRKMFGEKLKNVWLVSDTKALEEMVDDRTKTAMKLEAAETKLIKLANDARTKAVKKGGGHPESSISLEVGQESGSAAGRWIPPKKRPTHRLKPLIGKKVDTINWSRSELARLNPLIEQEQHKHRAGEATPLAAVFVEFFNQTEAQAAYQMVAHHQPLQMTPRVIGFSPEEVVWDNLNITWETRTIRNLLTIAAVVATIIFWSIPVAVVGAISQINYLEHIKGLHWLSFITKMPKVILGVITNLLPTVMLSLLMSLLPIYLRFMSKTAGLPTLSLIELRTHHFYFWFQVVQVFLVTTMTSAASAAVPQLLNHPEGLTTLLAQNLPLAANFYISYFILQGLTFASGALLQIVGLVLAKVLGRLLDSTPRKMYERWSTLSSLGWGTIFPVLELLTVISITYSCIAPLIMGFATIGLWLFYMAFRYNMLFVNTSDVDTKGLVYPRALQHTLVGCYLAVICMIGLFGIRAATGPLILMIILLIAMVLYHISLNAAIQPLLLHLPRSLEVEEALLTDPEAGSSSSGGREKGGGSADSFATSDTQHPLGPAPHKQPSVIKKFIRPDIYANYATMRRLVPHGFAEIAYSPEVERDAYLHPAVTDESPLLWIPRDSMGVSRQECAHTSEVTPMTDAGAGFNEKGRIVWDRDALEGRPPIYEEKIYY